MNIRAMGRQKLLDVRDRAAAVEEVLSRSLLGPSTPVFRDLAIMASFRFYLLLVTKLIFHNQKLILKDVLNTWVSVVLDVVVLVVIR